MKAKPDQACHKPKWNVAIKSRVDGKLECNCLRYFERNFHTQVQNIPMLLEERSACVAYGYTSTHV